MTRPTLLILSFSDISTDARVLKQVRLFVERYDVTTCGYGPVPHPGIRHIRIPDDKPLAERRREHLILRRYQRMYWQTPVIAAAEEALRVLPRFDVILADDIDTVGVALSLNPIAGVHADIHEYAPRQNEELPMWRLFVAPYVRWMCRRHLSRANSVTTVGQGVADEYRRVFGIDAAVVTNAAPYADLEPMPTTQPLRLVHSGAALRNRRIERMMHAVAQSETDVSLDLYLMPNDPEYLDELRRIAAECDRLTIQDPVPYDQLLDTLNAYDLGIHVIPPSNFNNRWSLPNKFFDYIQARLGLVIGPSPEMQRVLDQHGLGITAEGFDVPDIVRALERLDPAQVPSWKAAAHASARELSAESQVTVWADAIEKLLAAGDG